MRAPRFRPAVRRTLALAVTATLPVVGCMSVGDAPTEGGQSVLYRVVAGYTVDGRTMNGFRAWRAAGCDRCHGANQEGLVGPSLIQSLKTLSEDDFVKTVRDGRLDKGMQSFGTSKFVMTNIEGLYAYLKGRSNGDIKRAKVEEIRE